MRINISSIVLIRKYLDKFVVSITYQLYHGLIFTHTDDDPCLIKLLVDVTTSYVYQDIKNGKYIYKIYSWNPL